MVQDSPFWTRLLATMPPIGAVADVAKDPDDRAAAQALFDAAGDANGVAIAAMHGIQNADTHEEAPFRDWARLDRNRTGWVIAGFIAVYECAALEGFFSSVGPRWIDASVIARMRCSEYGGDLRGRDDNYAKKTVIQWTKPTAKGNGEQWFKRMQVIFGCTVDPSVAVALKSMISLRHAVAHGERPVCDQDFQPRSGEEILAWGVAVQWLALALLNKR